MDEPFLYLVLGLVVMVFAFRKGAILVALVAGFVALVALFVWAPGARDIAAGFIGDIGDAISRAFSRSTS